MYLGDILISIFYRICQQIENDSLKFFFIHHRDERVIHVIGHMHLSGVEVVLVFGDEAADGPAEMDGLRMTDDAARGELVIKRELFNEAREIIRAGGDRVQVLHLLFLRSSESELQRFGVAHDGCERSPKVMRDAGEKNFAARIRMRTFGDTAFEIRLHRAEGVAHLPELVIAVVIDDDIEIAVLNRSCSHRELLERDQHFISCDDVEMVIHSGGERDDEEHDRSKGAVDFDRVMRVIRGKVGRREEQQHQGGEDRNADEEKDLCHHLLRQPVLRLLEKKGVFDILFHTNLERGGGCGGNLGYE